METMTTQTQPSGKTDFNISIRPLQEKDLTAADRVMRLAFGTFLGLPDPAAFMGDASYVRERWRANPSAAFAAEAGGELVGSNFATHWGSVGFFGPLTVRPDLWGHGVGQLLIKPALECFARWGVKNAGLFTFAHSVKHVGLYQKFGFWPQFLTAIMSKPVKPAPPGRTWRWTKFSDGPENGRSEMLASCRHLTDAIHEGLDVGIEIQAVAGQNLGDTLLLWENDHLAGLAVCHCGPGTEAGSGTCYLKFGAVRPGPAAEMNFDRLLKACEEMAVENGLSRLVAGVNTARNEAYRQMLRHGFRSDVQGVVMQRHNDAGYNRPGVYVIDDWR